MQTEYIFRIRRCERCKEFAEVHHRSGPGAHKFYENVCDKCQNELHRARGYAMGLVDTAKRKGEIQRPDTCELCRRIPGTMSNGRPMIVAHHAYGYEHPLKVWWICHHCNHQLKGYKYHCGIYTIEQVRTILRISADK